MIEKFYNTELTEKQIEKLPDIDLKISHSTIKKLFDDYDRCDDCDGYDGYDACDDCKEKLSDLLIYLENYKKIE